MTAPPARTSLLVASLLLLTACPSGLKPPLAEIDGMTRPIPEGRLDANGEICGDRVPTEPRCGVLWNRVEAGHHDTCPDLRIEYGFLEDESPAAAPILATLAWEMARTPHLIDVEIVVVEARGEDVRVLDRRYHRLVAALGALGVAPERLSRAYQPVDYYTGYVRFEGFACARRKTIPPRAP